ncbi:MAG TPA: response regulator [Candidatus Binatia bacterium]|nr:response regulator [Candidatus Binatia bacterium]
MRILIVDDSKAMRGLVRRALRQAGFGSHDFSEAANGKEALDQIHQQAPDVVLSDWNMPEMSGIELLTALRGEECSVKFGFVTSEGTPEMKQAAIDAGASFFVTKPFTPEALEEALSGVIG